MVENKARRNQPVELADFPELAISSMRRSLTRVLSSHSAAAAGRRKRKVSAGEGPSGITVQMTEDPMGLKSLFIGHTRRLAGSPKPAFNQWNASNVFVVDGHFLQP